MSTETAPKATVTIGRIYEVRRLAYDRMMEAAEADNEAEAERQRAIWFAATDTIRAHRNR